MSARPWDTREYQAITDANLVGRQLEVSFANGDVVRLDVGQVAPASIDPAHVALHVGDFELELISPTDERIAIPWLAIRSLTDDEFAEHLAQSADGEARRVGRRLRQLRLARKLSAKEVAERAGITAQSLSRIELGRHDVVFSTLRRILAAMGYDLTDLAALDERDIFISHATEDKEAIARPLANELQRRGYSVWFDEFALRLGDSLRREIDRGLAISRFGVVILSPTFFAKEWPQRELDALTALETQRGERRILPIWHNVDHELVAAYSPTLADRVAVSSTEGLETVVDRIAQAIDPNRVDTAAFWARPVGSRRDGQTAGRSDAQDQPSSRPVDEELTRRSEIPRASTAAYAPELTWLDDETVLLSRARHELRQGEAASIRLLSRRLPVDVRRILASNEPNQLEPVLNRATALTSMALTAGFGEAVRLMLDGFGRSYNCVYTVAGDRRSEVLMRAESLWLLLIQRLLVVGGIAVDARDWTTVRGVALIPNEGRDARYYPYALRHGLIMTSRAGLLRRQDNGQTVDLSLITLAVEAAQAISTVSEEFGGDSDALLTRVCQFDALAALVAMGDARTNSSRVFYTNFARFLAERVEPAFTLLIKDPEMRQSLYPGSDDELALALRVLDRRATAEGFRFEGWYGISDPTIEAFLRSHPVSSEEVERHID